MKQDIEYGVDVCFRVLHAEGNVGSKMRSRKEVHSPGAEVRRSGAGEEERQFQHQIRPVLKGHLCPCPFVAQGGLPPLGEA